MDINVCISLLMRPSENKNMNMFASMSFEDMCESA